MRLMFGGGPQDVYLVTDQEGDLQAGDGIVIRFYATEFGDGNPYTDLTDMNDQAITFVTTSTGLDGRAPGAIAPFKGPDGVFAMWGAAAGQPRFLFTASNLGELLGPIREQYLQHVSQSNGHSTRLAHLLGVNGEVVEEAPDGHVVTKVAGLWSAAAPTGGGGGGVAGVTLDTDQTITGQKTVDAAAAEPALRVRAAVTGQTANIFEAYSGTDTGQGAVRQLATYLTSAGELRAIAPKTTATPLRVKGQPGQTANIGEITDTANVAKSWWAANYAFYAPNVGRTVTLTQTGDVTAGAGTSTWYNDTGVALTIRSVRASLTTAGSTTTTVDVNLNGTTIYTTQANRPSMTSAAMTSGKNTGMAVQQVPDGGYLTVDVDAAGTGAEGLTVQIDLA